MAMEGVLVTGVYGSGKSSAIEEMADLLEEAGLSYAAIDLDWLMWFDADVDDPWRERVFLANLTAVVANYAEAGVERFLMAGAVADERALAALRGAVPFRFQVVRLTVPFAKIETRLSSAVTAGRDNDLKVAEAWTAASTGVGIEDCTVSNDRPIRETAVEIADWLRWPTS
jgi:hypothetical protein